ncbi:hypothetical protein TRE132_63710 [Pseudomonas chlororaphis subsp. aurantiaca]|uniref:hypothetical protein n=1 Tax=Pseudomonas chlororaphis TaxID=587753 RepID=UPI00050D2CC6|nr:hypothetical protein [Pseudomonas chlororaphis]AIS10259.1 hypothetical protein JM49_00845 [Pseudomonas chlororaphis subsp. aurantiaca]AZD63793.1 hypothetical protein C4K18_5865 [Pseudomonas chlororaphis subsp. aurantiaca]AZD82721.1 hypothetical protein C4K15_6199 [Pseudomonas chlororaphis subsp. aurantiaca]BBN58246.1 hypothetical protein TRE132_63710 [Pseudomonas chlororaphis subsp. aurantiaca]
METTIVIDGVAHVFVTSDGKTELKITAETTPSEDKKPKKLPLPNVWLVTRSNGVPLFALKPAASDIQFRILTAEKLYEAKRQWFEPLADNYRKMIWVNPESQTAGSESYSAYKHFTWAQIIKFAVVDRMSISFAPKMPGDWKNSAEGGAKFLIVMIEGKPYWSDAVGQIPFATDTYRLYFEETKQLEASILKTVETGMKYGDGLPVFPKEDFSNEYDNYMVLRGALWASENFELRVEKVRVFAGRMGYREKIVTSTVYRGASDQKLRSSITQDSVQKYGVWQK